MSSNGDDQPPAANVLDILAALVTERVIHRRNVGRIALTKAEAAGALGVSVDHFERHVQSDLRVIRSGRLILVPVRELERWANDHASLTLDPPLRP